MTKIFALLSALVLCLLVDAGCQTIAHHDGVAFRITVDTADREVFTRAKEGPRDSNWTKFIVVEPTGTTIIPPGGAAFLKPDGGMKVTKNVQRPDGLMMPMVMCLDELRALAPHTEIEPQARFIDNGQVLTAAGISAGIDCSLHVVERLLGAAAADATARAMEYCRV